jgi:predicted phage tail protein
MPLLAEHRSRQERSVGDLLRELSSDLSGLLRSEVDLAKAELSEKLSELGRNLASLAVGGAVLFAGALALLAAVVGAAGVVLRDATSAETAAWLAPLAVGVVLGIVGYTLVKKALGGLRGDSLAPRQTTQTLQENKEWLKAKIG